MSFASIWRGKQKEMGKLTYDLGLLCDCNLLIRRGTAWHSGQRGHCLLTLELNARLGAVLSTHSDVTKRFVWRHRAVARSTDFFVFGVASMEFSPSVLEGTSHAEARSRNQACGSTEQEPCMREHGAGTKQEPCMQKHRAGTTHTKSQGRNNDCVFTNFMMSEMNKLGPFSIGDLNREIVADVVIDHNAPMVVSQDVNGIASCAAIAQRDLKILCVGCFRDGMTLEDNSWCRTCSGFVEHCDKKNSECRLDWSVSLLWKPSRMWPRLVQVLFSRMMVLIL